ncbi:MAG: hypothetical protein JWM55_1566 [Acidimicrobiaceae bacterium]|nr:hypothetical protein [Acidimicrobiaceae bacterium]
MMRRPHSPAFAGALALTCLCLSVVLDAATPAHASSSSNETRPYFYEAKILWESEAEVVSGALQNVPLVAAVADLERGLDSGRGDVSGYAAAVATLRNFESIPLTSETPAQMRKARSDWSRLNGFFTIDSVQATVLMDDSPTGAYYDLAQRAFMDEPLGRRDGVNAALLKFAVTDLHDQSRKQPTRAVLYAAAMYDLKNLEGASVHAVATSSSGVTNQCGQDILYLNVYFRTARLVGPGDTDMAKAAK